MPYSIPWSLPGRSSSEASNEEVLVFGPGKNLVGTVTQPVAGTAMAPCAVLLTNIGINPRCGPFRLNVETARRFASLGLPCLRFDLSGMGDSTRDDAQLAMRQQWVADTRAAMDEMQRRFGTSRFVMIGICSGADLAQEVASVDGRLRGVVLFDPYLYPTRLTALLALRKRVHAFGVLSTLQLAGSRLLRMVSRYTGRAQSATETEDETLRFGPSVPPLREFAQRLGRIVDGGTRVLMLYSGSFPFHYNYEGQAADNLRPYGLDRKIEFGLLPEADHVLMGLNGRRHFLQRCEAFIATSFLQAAC